MKRGVKWLSQSLAQEAWPQWNCHFRHPLLPLPNPFKLLPHWNLISPSPRPPLCEPGALGRKKTYSIHPCVPRVSSSINTQLRFVEASLEVGG